MTRLIIIVNLCLLYVGCIARENSLHPLSNEFIAQINQKATTWKAGRNFNPKISMAYIHGLMGTFLDKPLFSQTPEVSHIIPEHFLFPDNFDARDEWDMCPTIKEVRDQGSCGSCWAFGATEVMSDRECIHSGGRQNFRYSSEDLVSCCYSCGAGCNGGWLGSAFQYWVNHGIVSGGAYNSSQGCSPYLIAPCEHHVEGHRPECSEGPGTPKCNRECEANYSVDYGNDLRFGKSYYSIKQDEDQIKYEIIENGSVEAAFSVFGDFLNYKSGVYQHTSGKFLGGHAVRIIGYGVEKETPYWLVANSWNYDWGLNGLFKILRGSNECGIEESIVTGVPHTT